MEAGWVDGAATIMNHHIDFYLEATAIERIIAFKLERFVQQVRVASVPKVVICLNPSCL